MPYFSVILPVHNRPDALKEAIDSVLSQTFTDYELIVVDDGSTDDTPHVAREYGERIRCLRQENRGVSAARNAGVAASTAPWLAFLDSDDRWLPEKLARQARFIAENPGVVILQTDEEWIRRGRRVNPRNRHLKREGRIFLDSLELCLVSPSAAVMSRACFDRYGPFDEDLPACEDYDLWLRVTARETVGLAPERLVVRRGGHADQLSARYPAMDRFRVYAIMKLLASEGAALPPEYRERAAAVALLKTRILRNGAIKRNRHGVAEKLDEIIRMIEEGPVRAGACRFLVDRDWADQF
jgi:glycosyltransferase involved in cell wall biosynthesis